MGFLLFFRLTPAIGNPPIIFAARRASSSSSTSSSSFSSSSSSSPELPPLLLALLLLLRREEEVMHRSAPARLLHSLYLNVVHIFVTVTFWLQDWIWSSCGNKLFRLQRHSAYGTE